MKKNRDISSEKSQIIIKVAIVMAVFGIAYVICGMIGGDVKDFADEAAPWAFIGICAAGILTYSNLEKKKKEETKKRK